MSAGRQVAAVLLILAYTAVTGVIVIGSQAAFNKLFGEPSCRDDCHARGEELVRLHFAGGKSANHFCVCTHDVRISKRWIDLGTPIGIFLAIGVGGLATWMQLRRLRPPK